jgi:hypothetical protein
MRVSDQFHVSAAFTPVERGPGTHWLAGPQNRSGHGGGEENIIPSPAWEWNDFLIPIMNHFYSSRILVNNRVFGCERCSLNPRCDITSSDIGQCGIDHGKFHDTLQALV